MKLFKKFLIIALAVIMALTLFACGKEEDKKDDTKAADTAGTEDTSLETGLDTGETDTAADTKEAKPDGTEDADSTKDDAPDTNAPDDTSPSTSQDTLDVDPSVSGNGSVSDKDFAFSILQADPKGAMGYTLNVTCENKTDVTLRFLVNNATINGYTMTTLFSDDVPAGETKEGNVIFENSAIKAAGIESVDEIKLTIEVFDAAKAGSADHVYKEAAYYPTGLSPADIKTPERPTGEKEKVIIDNDKIAFVVLKTYKEDPWGYCIDCYIENKTNDELTFSWEDVKLDGAEVDPFWLVDEVVPGSRSVETITFFKEDFEDNGITDVAKIDFRLDVSGLNSGEILSENYTYNP